MTITRAKAITNVFANGSVSTMRLDEASDYRAITDEAVVWAMEHEPRLFYNIVLRYLQHLENTERRICSTCKHWEPFTGVCCGADSPYWTDFVDGDNICNHWKARLGQ